MKGRVRLKKIGLRLAYVVGVAIFVVAALEVGLRLIVRYNPSYYIGFHHQENRTISFPYGIIRYNSDGLPDDEFLPRKVKPRIAYFGDSVCYGVGAGHGYRVSEVLEPLLPEYEHMNFSLIGLNLSPAIVDTLVRHTQRFELDRVVFLMNLNDVFPFDETNAVRDGNGGAVTRQVPFRRGLVTLRRHLDHLRGRSYLYTHVRLIIKNYYTRRGFESHGQVAYEFFPEEYGSIIDATTARIRDLQVRLARLRCELLVVILPYEMQVSSAAEARYRELGVHWGAGFIARDTQARIAAGLEHVPHLDAAEAFVPSGLDSAGVAAARDRNALGEFFVYDRGDKLDWNHLNRTGHARLAEFLYASGMLQFPRSGAGSF